MGLYQNIKAIGKQTIVTGSLVAVMLGCSNENNVQPQYAPVSEQVTAKYKFDPIHDLEDLWGHSHSVYLDSSKGTLRIIDINTRPGDKPKLQTSDLNGDGLTDISLIVSNEYVGTRRADALSNGDGTYTIRPAMHIPPQQ